ncbi:HNH endonuclease [Halobacillus kuroshimensis]|uniref:Putative HNH nuclease YajD n=1 Tax=Halobacillus kuroshimensis TaxID=302481 RepID=A0ABS3E022_9BACI|nr:HNH endonuclease signature motif containing protein [Halobacillus kuroshimensis]MBN8236843.1 HNH endonuclease [Halobacillus kuroshimensis]
MDIRKINQLINENKLVKFYQSKEWRFLRQQALERDSHECQECKRNGRVGSAKNVHHIKEVKKFPWLALNLRNVESVCINCHNKEHKRLEKYIRKKKPKFMNEERW